MNNEPTQKHTLHLFVGDFQRLGELYPDLSASLIIRKLVRKHIEEHSVKPEAIKAGKINI